MNEIWRPIEGFEDTYLISNNNGWKNIKRKTEPKGRIVNGYRTVGLGRTFGEISFHILVAKAFPEICGEWFDGCQVHHKNFDKLDNRPENLIILTPKEHQQLHYKNHPDSFKKGSEKRNKSISKALKGRRNVYKHIPIIQLTINGDFVKEWECLSDVKTLGYSIGNICYVCKGIWKTAYGYKWKYKEVS